MPQEFSSVVRDWLLWRQTGRQDSNRSHPPSDRWGPLDSRGRQHHCHIRLSKLACSHSRTHGARWSGGYSSDIASILRVYFPQFSSFLTGAVPTGCRL